jgi:hypothetical protein
LGFKELSSLDADVTVALGKKDKTGKPYPKQAEGFYLGSRTVENKRGESKLHFLQTAKGNLGVWGTTDLNRKLGQAPVGSMVRVTSTGTKPTPNGDMYTYKVEVDSENTIEVSGAESNEISNGRDGGYDASDSYGSEDTDGGSDEEEGEDEDNGQASALAAAERKAKVEALLRGGKGKSAK